MEKITLTNKAPEFTITGHEEKMSAEILKVSLQEPTSQNLKLNVTDENGLLIYSKLLIPETEHPNTVLGSEYPEVAVNKRIIFSAFIKISIEAPAGNPFSVEVYYV